MFSAKRKYVWHNRYKYRQRERESTGYAIDIRQKGIRWQVVNSMVEIA
jgi:hypothetical protein